MDKMSANNTGNPFANVIIIIAATEAEGVRAEYDWLDGRFTPYQLLKQELTTEDRRWYDILTIKTDAGDIGIIYFDVTSYYGKN